jgi:phage tail-like protein
MAPVVNKYHYDPYKNFTFYVKWNDRYVAGVQKMSGIGGSPGIPPYARRAPVRTDDDDRITLERGISYDLEFQEWAKKSAGFASERGTGNPPQDFRKEMVIELRNQADGQLVMAYKVHRCWVSKFITLPGASENELAIDLIELQHEGWEQGPNVTGPDGPSLTGSSF